MEKKNEYNEQETKKEMRSPNGIRYTRTNDRMPIKLDSLYQHHLPYHISQVRNRKHFTEYSLLRYLAPEEKHSDCLPELCLLYLEMRKRKRKVKEKAQGS